MIKIQNGAERGSWIHFFETAHSQRESPSYDVNRSAGDVFCLMCHADPSRLPMKHGAVGHG